MAERATLHPGFFREGNVALESGVAMPSTETLVMYENYKALVQRATEVFGDEITASRWLSMPSADLDGAVPLEIVQIVDYAVGPLEPVFLRIEHGIDF